MLGLAGAALVFFTFPRVTIGGLRRASRPGPVAGLGDRVDLARAWTVADDPRVALRVRLDPAPPGEPRDLAMHWRARTLSRWTGHGWSAAEGGIIPATRLQPRPNAGPSTLLVAADVEVVGTFADGIVFTPEGWPRSVDFRKPGSPRPPTQRLYRNAAGDLFYQPVDGNDLRYQVVVDRDTPDLAALRGRGASYPSWRARPRTARRSGRAGPRPGAAVGRRPDPADAAVAIERWLTTARTRAASRGRGGIRSPTSRSRDGRGIASCSPAPWC
jgi:hypothetical protein